MKLVKALKKLLLMPATYWLLLLLYLLGLLPFEAWAEELPEAEERQLEKAPEECVWLELCAALVLVFGTALVLYWLSSGGPPSATGGSLVVASDILEGAAGGMEQTPEPRPAPETLSMRVFRALFWLMRLIP